MILSMTGYGKAVVAYKEKKINVEVKSLNSKSLDLSARIAPLYREKEMEIRRLLAQKLERGKVDFSLWVEKESTVDATPINAALVENYYKQIKAISASTGIPEPEDWFTTLLERLYAFQEVGDIINLLGKLLLQCRTFLFAEFGELFNSLVDSLLCYFPFLVI